MKEICNSFMNTPILFLIYNRPEYTEKVYKSIKEAKPSKLFVHADGPKGAKPEDIELCKRTREIVNNVDWDCELKTLFRDENLGCKLGVNSGITWFFKNVDEGIILEDDCLPTKSFFEYCERLLSKYRYNNRIMMISGSNPATAIYDMKSDYFFSHFYHVWGWATWKRAWAKMDINLSSWPKYKKDNFLDRFYHHSQKNRRFSEKMFDEVYNKKTSVWAIQWSYSCLTNNGFAILPKYNLVCNIGLSGDHNMNPDQLFLKTKDIDFNSLVHPKDISIQGDIENLLFDKSGLNKLII